MAFVVPTKRGGFEVRESRSTPNGPRSRTLVSFKEMDSEVIAKALERSAKPLKPEALQKSALRAGAPVAARDIDRASRETLRLLAKGERPAPMLRRLLIDALVNEDRSDRPADPSATVSDAARTATEWIGSSLEERANALRDLLELSDALPPSLGQLASPSLPEKVVAIHDRLGTAKVPHTIGGAFALGYYGVPRATLDIDINVFLPSEHGPAVCNALAPLGIDTEFDALALDRHGEMQLEWDRNPLDVFFSRDELHGEMLRRARRVPFLETTIPIPAPEHLAVRKAVLGRTKDWLDIEQILVATSPLDVAEIEAWLERMVGEADPRIEKLRELRGRLAV